ncbi:MAG TPA: putative porin [Opitutaceae bacterium]|nr:putative porin [Opitutaceae bacterium]
MTPLAPASVLRRLAASALLISAAVGPLAAFGAEPTKPVSALTFSADLRLRYEWDWDSQNAAGVARTDRDRARARARAGVGYKFSNEWSFGARARTGNRLSQQSPHLTFNASDDITDDFEVALDRYYLQFKQGPFLAWGGRNSTPFWQQNEMFWDEDVTPTGIAGSYETKLEQGSLTTTAGAFYLPDGMTKLNGSHLGAQLKYSLPVKPSQFTLAAGLYRFDGKTGAKNLRNRNGARDYFVGVLSAQWQTPVDGPPLTLGVDLIRNFSDYGATDTAPFAATHADEKNGYVFSMLLGQLKQPRDWQVGYFYAHIETLAVNAAYAQDDWARFGSATQSDLTDFEGHEFRATCVITPRLNSSARLFFVNAITSVQDGSRCRIDLNWKY